MICSELSARCRSYAKPSLCYSALPICRNQQINAKSKNSEASTQLFNLLNSHQQDEPEEGDGDDTLVDFARAHGIVKKRSPTFGPGPEFVLNKDDKSNKKIISQSYGDMRSLSNIEINRKVRRVCREECEMLESELCIKEYAIGKRHPSIGQKVPLVECSDLPMEDTPEARDCLSLGISTKNTVQES